MRTGALPGAAPATLRHSRATQPAVAPSSSPGGRCRTAQRAFLRDLFGGGQAPAEEEPSSASSPPFSTVQSTPRYELRVYGAFTAACAPYQTRPEGLQRLTEYLEGANAAQARLPATQPVITRYVPSGTALHKSMELLVSLTGTGLDSAPAPVGEHVSLRAAGGEAVAVVQLFGNVTPDAAAGARAQLLAALSADGMALEEEDAAGGFRLAAYGPMYSLKPRRNELMLRVRLG